MKRFYYYKDIRDTTVYKENQTIANKENILIESKVCMDSRTSCVERMKGEQAVWKG